MVEARFKCLDGSIAQCPPTCSGALPALLCLALVSVMVAYLDATRHGDANRCQSIAAAAFQGILWLWTIRSVDKVTGWVSPAA